MKKINLLDCTLRDGGYYNNWNFSRDLVEDYLNSLNSLGISFIEMGFRSFQSKDFKGPNWYTTDSNGNRIYPGRAGSKWRWVMTEGASASGNIASSCNGGNCKYNFSNGTYTVLNSGVTYKAGESIANRKAVP